MWIEKEEIKVFFFADDMIIYAERIDQKKKKTKQKTHKPPGTDKQL